MFQVSNLALTYGGPGRGTPALHVRLDADSEEGISWERQTRRDAADTLAGALASSKAAWDYSPLALRAIQLADDLERSERELSSAKEQIGELERSITEALGDSDDPADLEAAMGKELSRIAVLEYRVGSLTRLATEAKDAALAALRADLQRQKVALRRAAVETQAGEMETFLAAAEVLLQGGLYASMATADLFRGRSESGAGAGSKADDLIEQLLSEASAVGIQDKPAPRPEPVAVPYRPSDYGFPGEQGF